MDRSGTGEVADFFEKNQIIYPVNSITSGWTAVKQFWTVTLQFSDSGTSSEILNYHHFHPLTCLGYLLFIKEISP